MSKKEKITELASEVYKLCSLDDFIAEYAKFCIPALMEVFLKIWNLQKNKTQVYGDADVYLTKVIDTPAKKVLHLKDACSCAEITEYLIFYEIESVPKYEKLKITFHIRKVWKDEKTDYTQDNEYVLYPNFKWYEDRDFSLKYGDCRDSGYVLTYSRKKLMEIETIEVEKDLIATLSDIKFVTFSFDTTLCELEINH